MPAFTQDDRQRAHAAATEAFEQFTTSQATEMTAESLGGVDPKEFFCKHWDQAKMVLQIAKTLLPGWAGLLIDMITKAGDAAHEAICPK